MDTAVLDNDVKTSKRKLRALLDRQMEDHEKINAQEPAMWPGYTGDTQEQGDVYNTKLSDAVLIRGDELLMRTDVGLEVLSPLEKMTSRWNAEENRHEIQLFEGTTRGSRHCIVDGVVYRSTLSRAEWFEVTKRLLGDACKGFNPEHYREFQCGPIVVASAGETKTWEVHPDHGDRGFAEPGIHLCSRQKVFTIDLREEVEND